MKPGTVRVMEPVLAARVPGDSGILHQVKWDGVRMLCFIDKGVVLQNRSGKIKTEAFPELQGLQSVSGQPLIVDGEIVVIKDGRPDFRLVLKRNFAASPPPQAQPVSYIIFDILQWRGRDVRNLPLTKRQELLASLRLPGGSVSISDNFFDGEGLLAEVARRNWEGIVSKRADSPYVAGKSAHWCKVKVTRRDVFYIVGYRKKGNELASLLLAKQDEEGLHWAGAVGSGLSGAVRKSLMAILTDMETQAPPVPSIKLPPQGSWVVPLLQAEVEFLEWTEALTLRAPVFKALYWEGKRDELP